MNIDPATWPIIEVPEMASYVPPKSTPIYDGPFLVETKEDPFLFLVPTSALTARLSGECDYFFFQCANGDRFPGIITEIEIAGDRTLARIAVVDLTRL